METRRLELELLAHAGRLLLEYNESSGEIRRTLTATAKSLTDEPCHVIVSYGSVAVSLGPEGPVVMSAPELRFNMAVQASVHSILDRVRHGDLEPSTALALLSRVEADAPRHSRWLVVMMLGMAAASLAGLLGADAGAAATAGVATGLGLLGRQELGRRHFSLLMLPFIAGLIGAVCGGLAIRWGWTRTPGLVLIVPSLIVVPGPHFINGLLDLVDNFVPMGVFRLALALGLVTAAALGVVIGVELILGGFPTAEQGRHGLRLNLLLDLLLAGIVTCGFAAAYNTAWRHLAMAAAGGMAGHGLRYLALEAGWRLDAATLLGGLGVGVVSALIARRSKTPVAVIAYAGAVTMMPGLPIYQSLGGALQLARLRAADDSPLIAETLGNALQACLVVGALAVGLLVAVRAVQLVASDRE